MGKGVVLSVALAAAAAGAYGWDKLDEALEERDCTDQGWSCETSIPRAVSENVFRYGDQETERLSAIIGEDIYENFGACDRTIVSHMELDVARTRVVAEFTNQMRGNEISSSDTVWTPPTVSEFYDAFKNVADNKLGFRCGAVDAEYFADGQNYDDMIRQYATQAAQTLDFYRR